jgi:MFS family permease
MADSDDRLFTPAFIALTLSELAYFTAAGLVIGVTPFFVNGPIGSNEAGLGLVYAGFAVTTLVLRPYAGRMADRRGRRPLLIGGALLCATVLLAHTQATDLAVLIGLRLLLGVAEALFFVAGYAALADLAPPGRAGEALSYNSLALYLGVAVGPLIGQGLLALGGYGGAWLGGFALALLAAVLATRIPETAPMVGPGARTAPLIHRAAIAPGLALFVGVAAMSGFFALGGPHAERLGLEAWSVAFLVFGGVVVGSRIAFARLPDRLPPMRVAAVALLCCGIGSVAAALSTGITGLLAGAAVLAVGIALITPAVFAAIFAQVPSSERGAAAGTASAFIDLGFGGGPLVLGYVASSAGVPAAFGLVAALAAIAAIGAMLRPPPRPRAATVG